MKVYVDSEKRCHPTNPDGTFREVETAFFVGKCDTFIEGYVIDDSNGYRKIYPWKPYSELEAAQEQYEKDLADRAELESAYNYLLTGGIV